MAKEKLDDILVQAKDDYKEADEGWREIYDAGLEDMRFTFDVDGGQWPTEIKKDREGRPMLTVNKLLKFQRTLRGEARMNPPSMKVIPVDDKADVVKAELYDGIIRMIEYQSQAEVAYDTAYNCAISGSIGFFRITTEYEDELSFDQKICIKRIPNPYCVRYAPKYNEFDTSDARFCFIEETLSKKEFEETYPSAKFGNFKEAGQGTQYEGWFTEKKARIAEYFYKEFREAKIGLVELPGPEGVIQRGVMELDDKTIASIKLSKGKIVNDRKTNIPTIKWCKITGLEVLEEKVWPGKYIPVIPMMGDEVVVDGKRYILSAFRAAKDPQRMYNYWTSAATEVMALAPKNPYILTGKQIEGYETEWDNANLKPRMYLRYKNDGKTQKPYREPQIQIPTGFVAMMENTAFELEDSLGKYESSKGAPSNERSGRAIDRRVAQSDKGTFTFIDNRTRSIAYGCRQIIDLIPKIYDSERALAIRGEDGSTSMVTLNEATGQLKPDGTPEIANDLSVGRFDLIATVGASYSSRRQESEEMLKDVMQYAPMVAPAIAPLILKYSDYPGAKEAAEEVKKFLGQLAQQQQSTGG